MLLSREMGTIVHHFAISDKDKHVAKLIDISVLNHEGEPVPHKQFANFMSVMPEKKF